jgi:hypothetical protein
MIGDTNSNFSSPEQRFAKHINQSLKDCQDAFNTFCKTIGGIKSNTRVIDLKEGIDYEVVSSKINNNAKN